MSVCALQVETGGRQVHALETDVGLVTEALILSIAKLLPGALHVIVIQDCPACRTIEQWSSLLSPDRSADVPVSSWAAVKMVAAQHRVPVLDLRLPCSLGGNCTWLPVGAPVHPNHHTHAHIAEQALFAFSTAFDRRG